MKQKVIEFLQNLPKEKYNQFNEAFELYRKSEGKNFGVERSVNAAGFSERGLENLLYDLQKLHGITDVEKVASVVESQMSKVESTEGAFQTKYFYSKSAFEMTEEELIAWGIERELSTGDLTEILTLAINSNYDTISEGLIKALEKIESDKLLITNLNNVPNDLQNVPNDLQNVPNNLQNVNITGIEGTRPDDSHPGTPIIDIDVNDNGVVNIDGKLGVDFGILKQENENLTAEKEDLQDEKDELEEENEVLKDELETLKSLPKIDAKSIRVEFPFLNEKDCPDEFKILIADKITSWNLYLKNHADLQRIESGEVHMQDNLKAEIAASAIQSFDENQKIYDELNAYQTTGKVLGLHPIFKRLQLTREVEAMTPAQLNNYKGSSAKYFSDNRNSLAKAEKAKNTEKIELITNRVAEREVKLALVNKKLGINPK
ncbi:hypothetical protein ACNQGP_00770 [Flavobacterium sp. GT2N3]|uniref:hypothetical protein n=1 Tax=unclassified Flavobacterium TaxID=196869 RepID=UPI003AACA10C